MVFVISSDHPITYNRSHGAHAKRYDNPGDLGDARIGAFEFSSTSRFFIPFVTPPEIRVLIFT